MTTNKNRREIEKRIFWQMASIYCNGKKHGKVPCDSCRDVINYAHQRIEACKFGDRKTFCSKCTVHCFKPELRNEVKKIMRYSGPRMLFYHPMEFIKHILVSLRTE